MGDKIIGNPEGWHNAWLKLLEFINEYNFTPVAPVVIAYILFCSLILWGCWWVYDEYIREKKTGAGEGGH